MLRSMGVAALAGMLMSGCMPMGPGISSGSDRACMTDNATFAAAWACVRARIASRQAPGAQPDGLIDEGDILAGQVRAGKVSESEARKRLTIGLAHEAS